MIHLATVLLEVKLAIQGAGDLRILSLGRECDCTGQEEIVKEVVVLSGDLLVVWVAEAFHLIAEPVPDISDGSRMPPFSYYIALGKPARWTRIGIEGLLAPSIEPESLHGGGAVDIEVLVNVSIGADSPLPPIVDSDGELVLIPVHTTRCPGTIQATIWVMTMLIDLRLSGLLDVVEVTVISLQSATNIPIGSVEVNESLTKKRCTTNLIRNNSSTPAVERLESACHQGVRAPPAKTAFHLSLNVCCIDFDRAGRRWGGRIGSYYYSELGLHA